MKALTLKIRQWDCIFFFINICSFSIPSIHLVNIASFLMSLQVLKSFLQIFLMTIRNIFSIDSFKMGHVFLEFPFPRIFFYWFQPLNTNFWKPVSWITISSHLQVSETISKCLDVSPFWADLDKLVNTFAQCIQLYLQGRNALFNNMLCYCLGFICQKISLAPLVALILVLFHCCNDSCSCLWFLWGLPQVFLCWGVLDRWT